MEKVGKDAVMRADRDGRAGRGGAGETGGGKEMETDDKCGQTEKGNRGNSAGEREAVIKRGESLKLKGEIGKREEEGNVG